jgi:hypothetical protein
MRKNLSLSQSTVRNGNYWTSLMIVFFMFLAFSQTSHAEELSLEKFFKINPDDVNFDNPNQLFSGEFKDWDGSKNTKRGTFDDYKESNPGSNGDNLIVGKENGKIILLLENVEAEERCQYHFKKATQIYGQEVLHFVDTDMLGGLIDMISLKASFDFNNSRISFRCSDLGSIKTGKFSTITTFTLGSKERITKILPRTMIQCNENKRLINGIMQNIKNYSQHVYAFMIDHDDKKLLQRNGGADVGKVLQFSDDLIRIDDSDETKKIISTLEIDRHTALFTKKILLSVEGQQAVVKIEGSCEKIKNTKKF